jgi:hypothetical protein
MDLYLYLQLVIESVLTKDYATYKGLHTLLHTKHNTSGVSAIQATVQAGTKER